MKKKYLLTVLLVMILLVTGCDSKTDSYKTNNSNTVNSVINDSIKDTIIDTEETKVLNCTRKDIISEEVSMELSYKATYKGDYVEVIETEEKIISDNVAVLEGYKVNIESIYSPYKDVEHYNYNVEINGNTLISTTNIDYSKIDTDKLIEINSDNASLIKSGKIKISDIKLMYQAVGAICE